MIKKMKRKQAVIYAKLNYVDEHFIFNTYLGIPSQIFSYENTDDVREFECLTTSVGGGTILIGGFEKYVFCSFLMLL